MITILTLGTFDLPHNGHFNLLRRAKAMGDRLIVAVNTDEFVESYKGKRPVLTLDQRCSIIENCKYVDFVVVNEDNGSSIIHKIKPDWIVIGSDWLNKDYLSQIGINKDSLFRDNILYVPYTDNISSTKIKELI